MKRIVFGLFLLMSYASFSQNISVIKIEDLNRRILNLSDTTYIVNFWATWCAPCVKELPDFDSITKIYSSDKVKVLLISMDFKEDLNIKVIPFCKKKVLRSEVYLLDETNGNYFIPKVSEQWTGAIPATLIINNQKKYRAFYERKLNYSFLKDEIEKNKN
jgi:thiol-disulfide isomerase/thioredoxin